MIAMDWQLPVLLIVVLLQVVLSAWLIITVKKQKSSDSILPLEKSLVELKAEIISKQMDGLLSLRTSLDNANKNLNDRLAEGTETLDKRLGLVSEIQKQLGELAVQTGNIENIGKNIQALSDILKPPKQRGIVGEVLLENLLRDILPDNLIRIQYKFADGQRVDAAINIVEQILPIDSKFPVEAFQRLVSADTDHAKETARKELRTVYKKHVDAVSKYIRPDEKTFEFALLYIPSEAIYAFLIGDECQDEFAYALRKKVIPTSPGHIYGFLLTLVAVLSQIGISRNSREINGILAQISLLTDKLEQVHDRLAGSLRAAGQSLDKSVSYTADINKKLSNIKELGFSDDAEPQ